MNNHRQFFLPFRCNFFLHLPQAAEKACSPKRRARVPPIRIAGCQGSNPTKRNKKDHPKGRSFCLVRVEGFEPPASCSQSRRATSCAIPGYVFHLNKRYSNILHMINARGIRRKSQQICWPNTFIISAPIAIVNRKCNCNTQICVLTKNKCAYSWRIPSWNHRCRVLYYRHKEHIICQMYSKYFS